MAFAHRIPSIATSFLLCCIGFLIGIYQTPLTTALDVFASISVVLKNDVPPVMHGVVVDPKTIGIGPIVAEPPPSVCPEGFDATFSSLMTTWIVNATRVAMPGLEDFDFPAGGLVIQFKGTISGTQGPHYSCMSGRCGIGTATARCRLCRSYRSLAVEKEEWTLSRKNQQQQQLGTASRKQRQRVEVGRGKLRRYHHHHRHRHRNNSNQQQQQQHPQHTSKTGRRPSHPTMKPTMTLSLSSPTSALPMIIDWGLCGSLVSASVRIELVNYMIQSNTSDLCLGDPAQIGVNTTFV